MHFYSCFQEYDPGPAIRSEAEDELLQALFHKQLEGKHQNSFIKRIIYGHRLI